MSTTYIVITQHIVGGEGREFSTNYNWDGQHHASIDAAIDSGWKAFDHDDFNVGRVEDGKLVWFGWEHDELPGYDLAEITEHLGSLAVAS